jgi:hypothetical protein
MEKSRSLRRLGALVLFFLIPAGCETVPLEPSENYSGNTIVVNDYASFYRLGPQQAGGADRSLRKDERVMRLRKEFGYSRVQLEDGQVGYMANEDLVEAPPEPRTKRLNRKRPRSSASSAGEDYTAENFDDSSIPLPDPSLDILPEDVPLEPLPPPPFKITPPGLAPER